MKRILPLLAALLLALPAQAETWFPSTSGTFIHRDPFCMERILTLENYVLPAVQVSPSEIIPGYISPTRDYSEMQIVTADAGYVVCPHCYTPTVEVPAESELYYNPNGGARLHHNPECLSVASKYLPMTNIKDATGPIPQGICHTCGPRFLYSAADNRIWGASLEEKAKFLPGVWTLPSEYAITPEAAASIARDQVVQHLPEDIYTLNVLHYDYGYDVGDGQETYKVLITTALQEPVRLLCIDAITGEIYAIARPAEYLND